MYHIGYITSSDFFVLFCHVTTEHSVCKVMLRCARMQETLKVPYYTQFQIIYYYDIIHFVYIYTIFFCLLDLPPGRGQEQSGSFRQTWLEPLLSLEMYQCHFVTSKKKKMLISRTACFSVSLFLKSKARK